MKLPLLVALTLDTQLHDGEEFGHLQREGDSGFIPDFFPALFSAVRGNKFVIQ